MLLFKVPVTSNASRHFKSPLAMGEMPFKIKRASSVPISVVIDTGVNSNAILPLINPAMGHDSENHPPRLELSLNCSALQKILHTLQPNCQS